MKRLLKSWVFWAFVVLPIVAGLGYFFVTEEVRSFCRCGSWRTQSFWGLGLPERESFRITPALGSTEELSDLFRDVLKAGAHEHRWAGRYLKVSALWQAGRNACLSADSPSDLAVLYEDFPAFRPWLGARLKSGEIPLAAVEAELDKRFPPSSFSFGWNPP